MKKFCWNLWFTVLFIAVLVFGMIISTDESSTDLKITDQLYIVVHDNNSLDLNETIKCYQESENSYVFFLPSYTNLDDVTIHLDTSDTLYIDDIKLSEGLSCESFVLNKCYDLKSDENSISSIRFLQSEKVPAMFVSTSHDNLEQINNDKSLKENVNICIHDAQGRIDYSTHSYDDQIRGHGNSTWKYEKKPYNLYLDNPQKLLGMNTGEEWVLLANAMDGTNLRNKIVYDFISDVSKKEQIAPACEYVELYIDGEYLGLYLLTEKVLQIEDVQTNQRNYTMFVQNNAKSKMDFPDSAIHFDEYTYFEIADSEKYSENTNKQLEEFIGLVNNKLEGEEWADYIDIDSIAFKYLIEEIFSNTDGICASQYYYWDKDNHRLFAGPCWDYDLTFGDDTWVHWITPNNLYIQDGLWYKEIFEHQEFCEYYKKLYKDEFLPVINEYLNTKIIDTYHFIEKAGTNDSIRWSNSIEDRNNSPEELLSFFSEHIEFLNSIWLDEADYCRVSFISNDVLPVAAVYVPRYSSAELIPSPYEMGLGDYDSWYLNGTKNEFDKSSQITEDITLYVDDFEKASSNAGMSKKRILVAMALIMVFLVFFTIVVIVDQNRYSEKGKLMHGRSGKKLSS